MKAEETILEQSVPHPRAAQDLAEGLSVRGLHKTYSKRAVVKNVNLSVGRGQVVGLLGPNGAGKTTCFYMIVGLIKPDAGAVLIDGEDITKMPMYQRARMGISYLAQEPSIFRGMTVEQNVLSVVELREKDPRKRRETVTELLDELRISHLRQASAVGLSGGERRRVEIARALANDPSFLLMDEPFAGLDPLAVADISDVVELLKRRGIGVLITDHNVRETLDIVDRASIIYSGQVLFDGSPADMLANREVRRVYLGNSYTLDGEEEEDEAAAPEPGRKLTAPLGSVSVPPQVDLQLAWSQPNQDRITSWGDFWELTNKPKNSPFVFGGGIFCGIVFGLFLGTVVLHPNTPAPAAVAVSGQAAAQGQGGAHGQTYVQAFKLVDDPKLWTPYSIAWRSARPPYKALGDMPQTIETPTVQYDYAAVTMPLSAAVVSEEMILRIDVSDIRGKVGLSLVNPDGSPLVTQEQAVTAADGQRAVFFRLRAKDLPAEFLVRNYGDASGQPGSITVRQISYASASSLSATQMSALKKIGLNGPAKP
jgi:lipopolysaccharide export system ATP-binding protein